MAPLSRRVEAGVSEGSGFFYVGFRVLEFRVKDSSISGLGSWSFGFRTFLFRV